MKYIRTKDSICGERIYENDIPEPKNEHEKEVLRKLRNNIEEIVIKQADTIEELCDEFVAERKSDKEKLHLYNHNWREIVELCWKEKTEINLFGAIWTDKGLIYVAKMNEKGELELL